MNIYFRVKAAGKRKNMLELQAKNIPDNLETIDELITFLVSENVREYNSKTTDVPLFRYLSEREYEDALHTGKVGFGDRKNEKQQDEQEAVENALQSFKDGIFRILINETEVNSGELLKLKEEDVLTFIRLAMLAGRRF